MIETKSIKVRLTFVEEVLGGAPANKDIYRDYIGSKAPDASTIEDEVEALGVDEVAQKGMTVFARDEDGIPFLYDYHIKGFFKGACAALRKVQGTKSSGEKAYKKTIDTLIFPTPRKIRFHDFSEVGKNERALRASTPQGERVSLACSESVPAGSWVEFEIRYLVDAHLPLIREWLDYGILSGIGQWRNSGCGRFTWEELTD